MPSPGARLPAFEASPARHRLRADSLTFSAAPPDPARSPHASRGFTRRQSRRRGTRGPAPHAGSGPRRRLVSRCRSQAAISERRGGSPSRRVAVTRSPLSLSLSLLTRAHRVTEVPVRRHDVGARRRVVGLDFLAQRSASASKGTQRFPREAQALSGAPRPCVAVAPTGRPQPQDASCANQTHRPPEQLPLHGAAGAGSVLVAAVPPRRGRRRVRGGRARRQRRVSPTSSHIQAAGTDTPRRRRMSSHRGARSCSLCRHAPAQAPPTPLVGDALAPPAPASPSPPRQAPPPVSRQPACACGSAVYHRRRVTAGGSLQQRRGSRPSAVNPGARRRNWLE